MSTLDPRADALAQLLGRETDPFQAALLLAGAGIPVFPCAPGGKHPLVQGGRGFHDATIDVTQIARWWSGRPEANLAIPTGAASGVDVVDIDVHENRDGYAAFRRARDAGLMSGWSMLVRSPSNGLHVYFPHEAGRAQSSWQSAAAAVDFRGDGGYIMVPPSRVRQSGGALRAYTFQSRSLAPTAAVDADRLRRFLNPERSHARRLFTPRPGSRVSGERLSEWLAQRPEGARNASLFWASCRLAEAGAGPAEIFTALEPGAERAGLGTAEIERTVSSAYRRVTPPPTQEGTTSHAQSAADGYFADPARPRARGAEPGRVIA